ncbi:MULTISPECIES: hypothetical protein [unclassified Bradyrhizobium]|nr:MULTISPECIES: hypothetical protein [unclassified Bradyrhizobium]
MLRTPYALALNSPFVADQTANQLQESLVFWTVRASTKELPDIYQ